MARSKLVLRISGVIDIDWGHCCRVCIIQAFGIRSIARFIRSQGSVPLDVARKESIESMIGTRAAPQDSHNLSPHTTTTKAFTPN